MKVKAKLDLEAIKSFFIEHGEKVACAVIGVVFLLFVWGAIKRETLEADKQPDRLEAKTSEVRAHVDNSKFDVKSVGVTVVDYAARAKREPVVFEHFKLPVPVNAPLIEQKARRDDPRVLAVKDLQATAGYGVFALSNAAGGNAGPEAPPRRVEAQGERRQARVGGRGSIGYQPKPESDLKGRGYVVLTGLIPVDEQAKEFDGKFRNAVGGDPRRDTPSYQDYVIERAEVSPAAPDKLVWQPLTLDAEFVAKFEQSMPEVVHIEFVDTKLTSPLSPLVYEEWGPGVAHPPQIPFSSAQDETRPGAVARAPAAPVRAGQPGVVNPPPRPGQNAPVHPTSTTTTATPEPSVLEYKLFRAFDYTAKPKSRYRYRVKLRLDNPNFGVPAKYLLKPDAKPPQFVDSEPSTPSPMVAVPEGYSVLAASPKEKLRLTDPEATIAVKKINEQEGTQTVAKIEATRGAVSNVNGKPAVVFDPRDGMLNDVEKAVIKSDIVVLDIRGGQTMSKKSTSTVFGPLEVLVVDSLGNLRVRDDMNDDGEFEAYFPPEEPKTKAGKGDAVDDVDPKSGTRRGRNSKDKGKEKEPGAPTTKAPARRP